VVDLKAFDGPVLKASYFAAAKPGPGVLLLHQGNREQCFMSMGVGMELRHLRYFVAVAEAGSLRPSSCISWIVQMGTLSLGDVRNGYLAITSTGKDLR
jgi:hypothetical protein